MKDLFSIEGKTAVVTGGSRGIGYMIAQGMVEAGAKIYISSRKADVCDQVAAELSKSGTCISLPADLGTEEGCRALADEVAKRFPSLPFAITPNGRFKLCGGEFDINGDPVDPDPARAHEQDASPRNPVGDDTGERAHDHQRRRARERGDPDHERRASELERQPSQRDQVHPAGDVHEEAGHPQPAIARLAQHLDGDQAPGCAAGGGREHGSRGAIG